LRGGAQWSYICRTHPAEPNRLSRDAGPAGGSKRRAFECRSGARRGSKLTEILYRKWRPRTFDEVAGQEHVTATLKNALASNRVAHAYLFAGPRGTGKTTTGRLLGKALNCRNRSGGEPCNACESCEAFLSGRAIDLIELDAASNRGIDEIRSLRDKVAFAPGAGDYKVYLIDEVHMLTEAAFNALLKTLEEPPPHAVFILATTEPHKLPATIASRCQRFDFRRAPLAAMVKNLERICEGEGIRCEPQALELIARAATGSHRDAVNLLDQLATSYGSDLTLEHVRSGLGLIGDERAGRLARLAIAGDLAGGLTLIASVRDDGLDLRQFQRELVSELRDLLLVKTGLEPHEGATQERLRELREAVAAVPTARVLAALRAFGEADLKADPNSTLPLDIALAECVLSEDAREARGAHGQPSQTGGRDSDRGVRTEAGRAKALPETGASHSVSEATAAAPVRPQAAAAREPTAEPLAAKPVPPPSTPADPTLAASRARLRIMYERARAAGSPQLAALLNSACDIIQADENEVIFGFKYPVHATKASENQNLETLSAVVSEVLGRPVSVRCVHDPNVEPWNQRQPASRSPLVRVAQEMGGRILSPGGGDPA